MADLHETVQLAIGKRAFELRLSEDVRDIVARRFRQLRSGRVVAERSPLDPFWLCRAARH